MSRVQVLPRIGPWGFFWAVCLLAGLAPAQDAIIRSVRVRPDPVLLGAPATVTVLLKGDPAVVAIEALPQDEVFSLQARRPERHQFADGSLGTQVEFSLETFQYGTLALPEIGFLVAGQSHRTQAMEVEVVPDPGVDDQVRLVCDWPRWSRWCMAGCRHKYSN